MKSGKAPNGGFLANSHAWRESGLSTHGDGTAAPATLASATCWPGWEAQWLSSLLVPTTSSVTATSWSVSLESCTVGSVGWMSGSWENECYCWCSCLYLSINEVNCSLKDDTLIAADKRFMVHINCLLNHCFSSLMLSKTAQSISLNYIPNDKCLLITDEMTQMKWPHLFV